MDPPNRLLAAAVELQSFCVVRRWRFCFIGGIAVQHWGAARLTRDADVTVFTGYGDEASYVEALLARFASRIDDARAFALQNRVLLLHAANGIPLDIVLGALPFEEKTVESARDEEIVEGIHLRLAGPGPLVVTKAFADRAQDWLDLEGIVAKSGRLVDWDAVRVDLSALLDLKGERTALARLEALLACTPAGPRPTAT